MAKIKISELAGELGCESKELIAFLQEKGIEAKRSNSSIEDTDADVARKHFGKGFIKTTSEEKTEKAEKTEKKKADKKKPKKAEGPEVTVTFASDSRRRFDRDDHHEKKMAKASVKDETAFPALE